MTPYVLKETRKQSLKTIWTALNGFRENCIPEGDEMYDEQWSEICKAMKYIHIFSLITCEEIGIDPEVTGG